MASALIAPPDGFLIARHDGPVVSVFARLASFVRHSERPPASRRLDWFGSSTNGAMKSAFWVRASPIRNGTGFHRHAPVRLAEELAADELARSPRRPCSGAR